MLNIFIYLIAKYKSIQISLISRFPTASRIGNLIFFFLKLSGLTLLHQIVPNSEIWTVLHVLLPQHICIKDKTTYNNEYLCTDVATLLLIMSNQGLHVYTHYFTRTCSVLLKSIEPAIFSRKTLNWTLRW